MLRGPVIASTAMSIGRIRITAAFVAITSAWSHAALADNDKCYASYESAQQLRNKGELVAAMPHALNAEQQAAVSALETSLAANAFSVSQITRGRGKMSFHPSSPVLNSEPSYHRWLRRAECESPYNHRTFEIWRAAQYSPLVLI